MTHPASRSRSSMVSDIRYRELVNRHRAELLQRDARIEAMVIRETELERKVARLEKRIKDAGLEDCPYCDRPVCKTCRLNHSSDGCVLPAPSEVDHDS